MSTISFKLLKFNKWFSIPLRIEYLDLFSIFKTLLDAVPPEIKLTPYLFLYITSETLLLPDKTSARV